MKVLATIALLCAIITGTLSCKKKDDIVSEELTTYTVGFESKGGTPVPPDQTVKKGDKVVKPEDPFLENHHLEGWAKADNDATSALWNFETETVTADVTLYARWKRNEDPCMDCGDKRPGKALDVAARPGKERIEISWRIDDPDVVKTRIFWHSRADSIEVNTNTDTDNYCDTIPLAEGIYRFELLTYDAEDNVSLSVEVFGEAYGTNYEATLSNRPLRSSYAVYDDAKLTVEWNADRNADAGLYLYYTDNKDNPDASLFVGSSETEKTISDLKVRQAVHYSTIYIAGIDTFHAQRQRIPYIVADEDGPFTDITGSNMKNTSQPFEYYDDIYIGYGSTAKMLAKAKDWEYNKALDGYWSIEVREYSIGGIPQYGCLAFGTSTNYVPSKPTTITNGKFYQTITLEAGAYKFVMNRIRQAPGGFTGIYGVVARGNELPDVDKLGNNLTLGYIALEGGNSDKTIDFILSERGNVTLGFVVFLTGTPNEWGDQYMSFSSVVLFGTEYKFY